MSKLNDLVAKDSANNVDHLEEIVDDWLAQEKQEMLKRLRSRVSKAVIAPASNHVDQ